MSLNSISARRKAAQRQKNASEQNNDLEKTMSRDEGDRDRQQQNSVTPAVPIRAMLQQRLRFTFGNRSPIDVNTSSSAPSSSRDDFTPAKSLSPNSEASASFLSRLSSNVATSPNASASFLSSLARRIKVAETANGTLRKELIDKEKEILGLKRKMYDKEVEIQKLQRRVSLYEQRAAGTSEDSPYEPIVGGGREDDGEDSGKLRQENEHLRQELREIKEFLADYNLQWVGKNGSTRDAASGSAPPPFEVDFDKVVSEINKLNVVAEEDHKKQVRVVNNRASLVFAPPVPLTLFQDGIVVGNKPFRSFNSPDDSSGARRFVMDICDGYFPYEFFKSHPDGVVMTVTDRRSESYPFSSDGNVLGKATLIPGEPRKSLSPGQSKQVLRAAAAAAATRRSQQKAIDAADSSIAAEASSSLSKCGPTSITRFRFGSQEFLSQDFAEIKKSPPLPDSEKVLLQIRSPDGRHALTLDMWSTDTIADVKARINARRIDVSQDFVLQTGFPRRQSLTVLTQKLSEAGLVPRARVMMVLSKTVQKLQSPSKKAPRLRTPEGKPASPRTRQSPRRSTPPKKADAAVETKCMTATKLKQSKISAASSESGSSSAANTSGHAALPSNDLRRLRFPNHADPRGITL